jgi:hypothetical protein
MAYPQFSEGATRLDPDGRARNAFDRQYPRRFGVDSFLRTSPFGEALGGAFARAVPEEFWSLDADEDGDALAIIACPCGGEPSVNVNRTVECDCGRFYLNLATEVRVFRPDTVEAGLPPESGDRAGA